MSRLMRKPTICICENKDADQLHSNCEADQGLILCMMCRLVRASTEHIYSNTEIAICSFTTKYQNLKTLVMVKKLKLQSTLHIASSTYMLTKWRKFDSNQILSPSINAITVTGPT